MCQPSHVRDANTWAEYTGAYALLLSTKLHKRSSDVIVAARRITGATARLALGLLGWAASYG